MRKSYLILIICLFWCACPFYAQAWTIDTNSLAGTTGHSTLFTETRLDAEALEDVDMTQHIINPSFESSLTGWTNKGMVAQTNTSFGPFKQGNIYVEKWVSSAPLPDVSITQTITGLPNGNYTLQVAAQNILQNPPSGKTGAFVFANEAQTEVGERNEYTVHFLVVNETAVIGFKTVGSQGNWTAADDFRLTHTGFNIEGFKARLQTLKDEANGLLSDKMQNTSRASLESSISSAEQAINDPDIGTELAEIVWQMQNALAEAKTSIAAYRQLQGAIEEAKAEYGDGSGNGAAVLLEVIEKNESLVDNLDAAPEDLLKGLTEINEAVLAFRLENATDPAPVVTTDTYLARGATMALGRSTISVPVAQLLEHGFCWGTNPEPSIFDNKTTKYFLNNGFIYHIENLEPSTVYYMRAYAITNSHAIGYGDEIKVITLPRGTVTYQLNASVTNSGEHHNRIADAVESAVNYFNNLTSIQNHHLSVNFNAGTPTAEASYGGYMQFGSNPSYQRTGTALHEMGHTIGVGQHSMWYGPNSPLRATGSGGTWLGERANKLVQFLQNNPAETMRGDGVHMWPFGINGAHEDTGSEFLYISNSLLHQALGEDGLPPTGGFATPAYTFRHNDDEKYYIKTENETGGNTFLVENASGQLENRSLSPAEALASDHSAWHFSFNPATGYYQIRNAATGKYFTYQGRGVNGLALTDAPTPSQSHAFQLVGARYSSMIGEEGASFPVKAYWIVHPEAKLNPPTLAANPDGSTSTVAFNFEDAATSQRWLLLSSGQVNEFDNLLNRIPTAVKKPRIASGDSKITLTWDFIYGVKYDILKAESEGGNFSTIATDVEALRYEDQEAENNSTYYYKIVAHNTAGRSPETAVLAGTPQQGRHLYLDFNETAGIIAEDKWGGYHATLAPDASRLAMSKDGSGLWLNGTPNAYATLSTGAVSSLNDFTISTWVKMDALSNWMRIFDFGTGTSQYMFLTPQVSAANGKSTVRYAIKNGGAEQLISYPYSFPLNTWVHFAITQTGNTAKLYINGEMVGSNTAVTIKPADLGLTTQNYIGKSQFNDPILNGSVDDFRIYNYGLSASQVQGMLAEFMEPQTITFNVIGSKEIGDPNFDAGATTSSGLAVSYTSSNPSVAVVENGLIRIVGAGTTTITASQTGNERYLPADEASQELVVSKKAQGITFIGSATKELGDADFDAAEASSGLPVSYTSSNEEVAIIVDGKVRVIGAGTTTITASQGGDEEYLPAEAVSQTFEVNQAPALSVGDELYRTTIKAYPNPVKHAMYIDGLDAKTYQYSLFSLAGVKVANGTLQQGKIVVPISLKSGSYILQVSDGGKAVLKRKVFIRK